MYCLLGCLILFVPRVALIVAWLFTDLISEAYEGILWPLLGFLCMPVTALAYAWCVRGGTEISGGEVIVMIVAVLADFGLIGGGAKSAGKSD